MLNEIDDILNGFTMYRVLLYGLAAFLVVAAVFGLTGTVSLSAGGLLLSVIILCVSCYAANKAFSALFKAPTNSESWLITALILSCVLPPVNSASHALYVVLAGVLAMASKFLITFRGTHIFNPAAFAAFILSITALLPATWWIAAPWLTPFTVLLGLIVLRKQRKFKLFFAFALPAVAMLLLTGSIQGMDAGMTLKNAALSWPIIFFGSIMLTEPSTLPPTSYYQTWLAIIVGVLFTSQLHAGRLSTTPQAVLLLGNLLVLAAVPAFGAMLKIKQIRQLNDDVYEMSFLKPDKLSFEAGQYAQFTLPHAHVDARGNRRTFSLASAPSEPEVRIAFRHFEKGSSFKRALLNQKPGNSIRLSHVAGNFTLAGHPEEPLLLIAGGIGLTPFLSMIGSLRTPRDIVLLYMANGPKDFVYQDELKAAEKLGMKRNFLQKRLTPEELKELIPDINRRLVYLSGPDGMVRGYKKMLGQAGIPEMRIKTDHFTGY